jgi:hypothetical protein
VSASAVNAHEQHEHDGRRDIIGVHSAAACPHASATAGQGHNGHEDEDDRNSDDDGDHGHRGHNGGGPNGHTDADAGDDRSERD